LRKIGINTENDRKAIVENKFLGVDGFTRFLKLLKMEKIFSIIVT